MKRKLKENMKKAAIVVVGAAMVISIFILTSAPVQSRFVGTESGTTLVFIDKYVPETLRDDFASGLESATSGFLLEADLLAEVPARGPVAYFAADRHYGVISADDPLVRRKLRGRPSSDFVLFRSIGTNFYANELVTRSVASQDGSYVFVNIDEHWRASVLHAYVHAIAAANAPAAIMDAFKPDAGYDPELRFAFRFVDEVFALLASDLLELSGEEAGLDGAWSTFEAGTKHRYTDLDSDVRERQAEIIMATYDLPQKSAEFYAACNSFAAWIIQAYGKDAIGLAARTFLSGDYRSLDDPFRAMGGLGAAIAAWKGDDSVPR